MNELYKLLQNIQQIVIANNQFAQSIEARIKTIEDALTLNIAPNADGADSVGEIQKPI